MKLIKIDPDCWVQGQGYQKQRLADRRLMRCEGALVQMVVVAPGEVIPVHFHQESTEYYYVIQGRCRLATKQESLLLTPGEMVVIQPGEEHALYNEDAEPFHLLVFKTNAPEMDTYWPAGDPTIEPVDFPG